MVALLRSTHPDVVIWATAAPEGSPAQLTAVDHLGVTRVFKACEAAGVDRVLVVSTIDARDLPEVGPAAALLPGI